MKNNGNNSGYVFILTIIIFFIICIISFSIIPIVTIEYQSVNNYINYQQAFYIAKAGMEEAWGKLNNNWNDLNSLVDWTSLKDAGEYKYIIHKQDENIRVIISYGRVGNIERKLEAIVEKKPLVTSKLKGTDNVLNSKEENDNILNNNRDFNVNMIKWKEIE